MTCSRHKTLPLNSVGLAQRESSNSLENHICKEKLFLLDQFCYGRLARHSQLHWLLHFSGGMTARLMRDAIPYNVCLALQEDHYAAPDLFHVLRSMEIVKKK